MAKRVVFSGPHLWNLHFVDDGLVFEQGTFNAAPVFWHATVDGVREIARLALGRPRGVLQGVEDGSLLCLEPDGTLAAVAIRDGHRIVIRRFTPLPAAIAVTPEQVVWANSESRFLDGFGDGDGGVAAAAAAARGEGVGEIWRWWRGTEVVEKLGEHSSFRPDLVVAPALGASSITAPVYLAADDRLGVVDTDGLRWLATSDQPISHLACSADSAFYASGGRVFRHSYATGEASIIQRVTIPLGLAVHGHKLVVLRNSVIEQRQIIETSGVLVIDLRNGSGVLAAENVARPGAVAAGDAGIALVEGAIDYGGVDRLVMIDWDSRLATVATEPAFDDALWQYPFSIQWWRPEGDGGFFQLDREGNWSLHARTPSSGTLSAPDRVGILRSFEAWRRANLASAGAYVDLSITRGWLAAWGIDAWFRPVAPDGSPASTAVATVWDLVIRVCPAFAEIVLAMP